jgi:hypothetical protein
MNFIASYLLKLVSAKQPGASHYSGHNLNAQLFPIDPIEGWARAEK